jgi:hypothetical protein
MWSDNYRRATRKRSDRSGCEVALRSLTPTDRCETIRLIQKRSLVHPALNIADRDNSTQTTVADYRPMPATFRGEHRPYAVANGGAAGEREVMPI